MVNDDVNDLSLITNKFALSGAYQLNKKGHLLRIGAQFGIVLRQSDFDSQTFPEQWNYALGIFDNNVVMTANCWIGN